MSGYDNEYYKSDKEKRKALLKGKAFDYDYGDLGEKLKPGHPVHDKLVQYALDIGDRGLTAMRPYHPLMRKADWKCTGFTTPEDANPRNNPKDRERTIVHTMSFEAEENLCAAYHAVFNQDPVFKWKPFPGKESLIHAATAEYMIQRHVLWGDYMLHTDDLVRSAFRYGVGMGNLSWEVERAYRPVDRKLTAEAVKMAAALTGEKISSKMIGEIVRDSEEQVVAEYSQVVPWDMYNSFFDPSVTPNTIRKAAFRGTVYTTEANQLLTNERENPGQWFNGWYAKLLSENHCGESRLNQKNRSGREDRAGTLSANSTFGGQYNHFSMTDVLYIECSIIPSDWEVGEENYPVKYMLAVAADEIVVGFGKLELWHGGDSGVSCAPNADGHSLIPISHILATMGIHEHIDHILRCTQASMTKNINGGTTIFNHNILSWDDFVSQDSVGKVIRPIVPALSAEMMNAAMVNIPHLDNSAQHVAWVQYLEQVGRGNGGFDIGAPGAMADAERSTRYGVQAQETATSRKFNRLAYKIGAQMATVAGWKMLYNLTQFGKMPQHIELGARYADRMRKAFGEQATGMSFMANPSDIQMLFEMEPYSGTMPKQDDMSAMGNVVSAMMGIPEIAASMHEGIPHQAVYKEFLRKSGFESVDDFPEAERINSIGLPDQFVEEQAQAGNLVPMGELRGMA